MEKPKRKGQVYTCPICEKVWLEFSGKRTSESQDKVCDDCENEKPNAAREAFEKSQRERGN